MDRIIFQNDLCQTGEIRRESKIGRWLISASAKFCNQAGGIICLSGHYLDSNSSARQVQCDSTRPCCCVRSKHRTGLSKQGSSLQDTWHWSTHVLWEVPCPSWNDVAHVRRGLVNTRRCREKYGPGGETERSEVVIENRQKPCPNQLQVLQGEIICCLLCTAGLFPLLKMLFW